MASQRDKEINTFAIMTFRDTADRDYIAARLAFRAELFPQFMTASHQAIEKYLKCVLCLYRVRAADVRHDVGKALERAEARLPFKLDLHAGVRRAIQLLDESSLQRYFELPWSVEGYTLARVDHAVWELRRYCQPIDHEALAPDGTDPEVMRTLVGSSDERRHAFKIPGGLLEEILAKPNHPARRPLVWQNLFFSVRRRKTVKVAHKVVAANPPLLLLPQIVDDVAELVYLPPPIKKACKEIWGPEMEKQRTKDAAALSMIPRGAADAH